MVDLIKLLIYNAEEEKNCPKNYKYPNIWKVQAKHYLM